MRYKNEYEYIEEGNYIRIIPKKDVFSRLFAYNKQEIYKSRHRFIKELKEKIIEKEYEIEEDEGEEEDEEEDEEDAEIKPTVPPKKTDKSIEPAKSALVTEPDKFNLL